MNASSRRLSVLWLSCIFSAFFILIVSPAWAAGQRPPIDKASLECIGCHDAAVSPGDPMQVCHEAGCDHRIGVSYAEAATKDRSLAPVASLPPELKLVEGKMSCVTCHVPYSEENHEALSAERARIPEIADPMLSLDNAGSALCLACHLK